MWKGTRSGDLLKERKTLFEEHFRSSSWLNKWDPNRDRFSWNSVEEFFHKQRFSNTCDCHESLKTANKLLPALSLFLGRYVTNLERKASHAMPPSDCEFRENRSNEKPTWGFAHIVRNFRPLWRKSAAGDAHKIGWNCGFREDWRKYRPHLTEDRKRTPDRPVFIFIIRQKHYYIDLVYWFYSTPLHVLLMAEEESKHVAVSNKTSIQDLYSCVFVG